MKHLVILLMSLLIVSCEEPTPQELREQTKQIEEKVAQQTAREAMTNCKFYCDKGDSQIFYLDGHKYRMWYDSRGQYMAVVHDPECEMNDIKAIIKRRY